MRSKDEILDSAGNDIRSDQYKEKTFYWMEYRKLELLCDIRDILVTDCKDAMNALIELRKKD